MTRLARRVVPAVILAAMLAGGCGHARAATAELAAAARAEGQVTWYVASLDARNAKAVAQAFTAKHGPKVNVVRAPPPVMFQRLTQDLTQKAPQADVFSSIHVGNFVTLKENDALMAYKPVNAAKLLPAFQGLDEDGMFHATVASAIVIAYNTDKIAAEHAPAKWTDLLAPQWAGKIALAHPAFSGFSGNWAAQMQKLYGEAFFRGLSRQKPHVSRSTYDIADSIASGEHLIAALPVAPVLEYADKGMPLAAVYPRDGAVLVATPSAVLKDAPHPNAARLFMEFLLGPETGRILVKARYESMRADVPPLPGAKSVTEIKTLRPTIEESVKGVQQVSELWRGLLEKP